MTDRPQAISLFSGAGGIDIGLEQAGFDIVAATDFDRDCVATLKASRSARLRIPGSAGRRYLATTKILHAAIEDLASADLRPAGAGDDWAPDALVGGPPCQPFSSSGRMGGLTDPRGRLFQEFVRVADELKPRVIMFENVRGLVTARGPSGEAGEALHLIRSAFEEVGYATRFTLLNAADYGAAQRRVRLIMVASRQHPLPEPPIPTHARFPVDGQAPWVSLGEFLDRFPDPAPDEIVRPSSRLAGALAQLPEGSGLKSPGSREPTRPGGHWGYRQGTFIADRRLPARTVTAASTQDWIRLADGALRRLTWREAAGLQGFPRSWRFQGNTASRFRQVGNAVPVPVARAVGEALIEALDNASQDVRPLSAPYPVEFTKAIAYTERDHRRNGESRRRVRQLLREGKAPVAELKGVGRQELSG